MARCRAVFVAGALSLAVGGPAASEQNVLPAPQPADAGAGIPPEDLALLGRVIDQISRDYVDSRSSHELMLTAVRDMVKSLDSHSELIENVSPQALGDAVRGEFAGIGVELDVRDGLPVVVRSLRDSPALRAGLAAGDRIESVDGRSLQGVPIDEAILAIKGPPRSVVHLRVLRAGATRASDVDVERQIVRFHTVDVTVERGLVLARVSEFLDGTPAELIDQLALQPEEALVRGLVLDFRGNPGGVVDAAVRFASAFLPPNTLVITAHGRPGTPPQPYLSAELFDIRADAGRRAALVDTLRAIPLVVIVDADTASSAEIVASALQDHRRARVVGCTPSLGKGTIQSIVPLSNRYAIKLTTARFHTSQGSPLDGHGVTPDERPDATPQACAADPGLALATARHALQHAATAANRKPATAASAPL
jgi:carboxyl-terminal processing protease